MNINKYKKFAIISFTSLTIISSIGYVQEGNAGLKRNVFNKNYSPEIVQSGVVFKSPWSKIETYPIRPTRCEISSNEFSNTLGSEYNKIRIYNYADVKNIPEYKLTGELAFKYSLSEDSLQSIQENHLGISKSEFENVLLINIEKWVNVVTQDYTFEEIYTTRRDSVNRDINVYIKEKGAEKGIIFDDVELTLVIINDLYGTSKLSEI